MTDWRRLYKVHPAADVFPMMSEAELKELAEDIKGNGLQSPIVVWSDDNDKDWLLDGRNRLTAIEMAGVEFKPYWRKTVSTGDPLSMIIALNIKRRHLGAADRARLAAAALDADKKFRANFVQCCTKPRPGRPGSDAAKVAKLAGVSKHTALEQLEVQKDSELKARVDSGELKAQQAGRIVRERKQAAGSIPRSAATEAPPAAEPTHVVGDPVDDVMRLVSKHKLSAAQVEQLKLRLDAYVATFKKPTSSHTVLAAIERDIEAVAMGRMSPAEARDRRRLYREFTNKMKRVKRVN
jgi:ParB-like chromosome segregation protein Spo0J